MKGLISILSSQLVFAIDPRIGAQMLAYGLMVAKREREFNAEDYQLPTASEGPRYLAPEGDGYSFLTEESARRSGESTVLFPIHGPLFAQSQYCGPAGMDAMSEQMRRMANDQRVSSVILDFQSPGGQVTGNEDLADGISYLASRKPVVSYVNGLCCSGAYSLASRTHHIVSGSMGEIGSVGVMISYLDFTKMMREAGVEQIVIRSSLSPEKNKFNFAEPTTADISLIQDEMLDPIAKRFVAAVKKARPQVKSTAMEGAVYMADEARQLGLIDTLGTFEDAVKITHELRKKPMSFFRPSGGSGTSADATTPETIQALRTEQEQAMQAMQTQHEQAMQAMQTQHQQAIQQLQQAHATQIESLRNDLTTVQQDLTAAREQITRLAIAPANEIADPEGKVEGAPNPTPAKTHRYTGFGQEQLSKRLAGRTRR